MLKIKAGMEEKRKIMFIIIKFGDEAYGQLL